MEAELTCSDEIKDTKVEDDAFKNMKVLLSRGVPKGGKGPKVVSYSIVGNSISVELVSGRYVRCHEAILRINKHLSQVLGKELHIGIRSIEIKNYFALYSKDRV
jgi:seryl-tRNA synthetase